MEALKSNLRTCPICNSKDHRIIKNINEFSYGICNNCSHIYQLTDFGKEFYETHEYRTQFNYHGHSMNRVEYIANFIGMNRIDDKTLLDVGCGRGGVLYYLNDMIGLRGHGVNTYPEESYLCDEDQIIGKTVFDIKGENKYDYIIMSHSLEHVVNLNETLNKIRKLLKPCGILYIEVPHYFYTKQKLNFVFTPEHISYFHKESLYNVLINNNFMISKYKESTKWSNIKVLATPQCTHLEKPKMIKINYYIKYMQHYLKYYLNLPFNKLRGPND